MRNPRGSTDGKTVLGRAQMHGIEIAQINRKAIESVVVGDTMTTARGKEWDLVCRCDFYLESLD